MLIPRHLVLALPWGQHLERGGETRAAGGRNKGEIDELRSLEEKRWDECYLGAMTRCSDGEKRCDKGGKTVWEVKWILGCEKDDSKGKLRL